MIKKTAIVICLSRGTYNKTELGYLHRYHANKRDFIDFVDRYRLERGQPRVWELDGRSEFSLKEHNPGQRKLVTN